MRLAGETLFCVAIKALVHLSQTAEFIIRQVIERGCLNSSVKRNLLGLGELIPHRLLSQYICAIVSGTAFLVSVRTRTGFCSPVRGSTSMTLSFS